MINYPYIAGLFDGDGTCNIHRSGSYIRRSDGKRCYSLIFTMSITSKDRKFLRSISDFLSKDRIIPRIYRSRGSYTLYVQRIADVRILVYKLRPFVVLKKHQIITMGNALSLHERIENKHFSEHWREFDTFRHRIHERNIKGRRPLNKWE